MARLIDADQIENKFLHWLNEISKNITNDIYQGSESDGIAACFEEIREAPTIDPESLRLKAHWLYDDRTDEDGNLVCWCSRCEHGDRHSPGITVPYCWFCGAKMEVLKDECNLMILASWNLNSFCAS